MIGDGLAISSKGGTKMLVYEVKTTRESPSNKLTKLRYQLTKMNISYKKIVLQKFGGIR